MRCPKCDYAYVKNVGKKERYINDKKRPGIDNEKKYECKRCNWKSGQ